MPSSRNETNTSFVDVIFEDEDSLHEYCTNVLHLLSCKIDSKMQQAAYGTSLNYYGGLGYAGEVKSRKREMVYISLIKGYVYDTHP